MPIQRAMVARAGEQAVGELEVVPAAVEKRSDTSTSVPVQAAAMSLTGTIVPFENPGKRSEPAVAKRTVPVQAAAMSLTGTIVPFENPGKRSEVPAVKRDVPVQAAAMSLTGTIVPFENPGKRSVQDAKRAPSPRINTFPVRVASRSDGGAIVAF